MSTQDKATDTWLSIVSVNQESAVMKFSSVKIPTWWGSLMTWVDRIMSYKLVHPKQTKGLLDLSLTTKKG
jgi:hypothetical protein